MMTTTAESTNRKTLIQEWGLRAILGTLPPMAAAFVQWYFWPLFKPLAWILFYPAVFVSSWIGGLFSGLLATAVSFGLASWLFLPTAGFPGREGLAYHVVSLIFIGMGTLFSLFHHHLRKVKRNAEEALRAELRLRESLHRTEVSRMQLAAIVESSTDAIIGKTLDGTITSWNEGAEHIYGYTAAEVIGRPVTLLAPPEYHAEVQAYLDKIRRGGSVAHHESVRRRKDGALFPVSLTLSPIKDCAGVVIGISTIARDVTAWKQLEAQLRSAVSYNRSLIEASLDPLVTISREGTIMDVNEATVQITGVERASLIGSDFSDYFTEPERARAGYREVLAQGFVANYPLAIRHTSGRTAHVLYNATMYHDESGTVAGIFAAARDVTERTKAELEREQYFKFFHASTDLMGIADPNGAFKKVNPAFTTVLGYSEDDLLAKPFIEFIHPDDQQPTLDEMARQMQRGFSLDFVNRYLCKDGSFRWLSWRATVNYAEGLTYATARDITDRKRAEAELLALTKTLEAERQRFYDVLETLPVMICLLTPDHHVTFANRAFREKFGEANGRHCYEYCFGSPAACAFCESYRVLETGEPHRWEVPTPDGSIIDAYDFPFTDVDGSPLILEMDVDITEHRRAEARIRELNETLERRVSERTAELEATNQELEAFSYSVSHDLRTPLRAIDGFSTLLAEEHADRLDQEGHRLIRIILDNTSKMSKLIDDILAFSRSGRLEMKAAEVAMDSLVGAAWQESEPLRAGRNIRLEIKALPSVRGDAPMLRQVWANLLGNAIKFSKPREIAHIEVGSRTEGREVTYYVRDDGVGFEPEYAHKLFGMFQRLHGVDEFEGTGIGLAIVKRIVTRHGGRVRAEGRVQEGATIYFTLPLEETP